MSEKEAEGRKQRYRSQAESDGVAAEYESSGLRRKEFCQQTGVSLNTLANYVTRYRKRKASSQSAEWIAVEVDRGRDGSELTVLLTSGRRVEVKRGFDSETLRHLLAVLE